MNRCLKSYRINLPGETAETLREICLTADNLYLMHNRFSYWDEECGESKIKNESVLKLLYDCSIGEERKCRKCKDKMKKRDSFDSLAVFEKNRALIPALNERTKTLAASYGCKEEFPYVPLDKLMLGGGGTSPYSSLQLITLHPLYGLPYIPATAIKGMLSQYWIREVRTGDKADFYEMFGSADEPGGDKGRRLTGKLVFFDTFPDKYALGFDVQTPHYPQYYQSNGKTPPSDDQDPRPLIFPYVKEAQFHIHIACRDAELWKRISDKLACSFRLALQCYGIGAKTAYGNGLAMQDD